MTTTLSVEKVRALRRAAARATLAPSVHNTQPWRLTLGASGLEFALDRTRQLKVLDPTGRQMHLSIGCAVFNARVALAGAGFAATVAADGLDEPRADHVATVGIGTAGPVDRELSALDRVVELRQTNRRRFAEDPVPAELVETLISAAKAEGAVLIAVEEPDHRQALAKLTQAADAQQIADPAYRAELRAWTGVDVSRRDGIPARVVPHVTGAAGDDMPIRDFDSHGDGWLPAETRSSQNQCLLVLGTVDDDPAAWLRGGQALERAWLEITRSGHVASLFTQTIEVPTIRVQLREQLHLAAHPHVVLRVGRAPATPSTSRRPLSDVFEDASDE